MDFVPTDQQKLLRKTVREFVDREIAPKAAEVDEKEVFPRENLQKIADMGLYAAFVPEEYGGSPVDAINRAIMVEELARGCPSTAVAFAASCLIAYTIYKFGSDELRRRYLPSFVKKVTVGAFAITEPHAGSDVAAIRTRAKLVGDEYVINGTKAMITNGAEADVYLILAKLEDEKGMNLFVVERDFPGFSPSKKERLMGFRGAATSELVLNDCRVPKENVLGEVGKGIRVAMAALDVDRTFIGAIGVGIAQAALEASIRYAGEREAFGKKIGEFQAIQFMIADMAMEVEAARLFVYKAADLWQKGLPFSTEAAMAKLKASEVAVWSALKAIEIHGGYGYSREFPVERYLRDAKALELMAGTSEVQRMVIGKAMLKQA